MGVGEMTECTCHECVICPEWVGPEFICPDCPVHGMPCPRCGGTAGMDCPDCREGGVPTG